MLQVWTCPWALLNNVVQHMKPGQAGMVARSAVQGLADTVHRRLTVTGTVLEGTVLIGPEETMDWLSTPDVVNHLLDTLNATRETRPKSVQESGRRGCAQNT